MVKKAYKVPGNTKRNKNKVMSIFSKELENFLQGRGLLEQAKMLAQENGTTYTDDLWSAFEWVKSPQGYSFWRDLQAEFSQQTRRSNQKKGIEERN